MRYQSSDESLKSLLALLEGDIEKTRHGVSDTFREAHSAAIRQRADIMEELALREQERKAGR